jgi:cation diffusion facilitator family transporter
MSTPRAPDVFDITHPLRYQASRRVVLVSIAVNLALTLGQIVAGLIGHSQALVADGFHTLADLSTDALVLFALKHSARVADEEHPYGHARIETAVTVALGTVLLVVGAGIALRAGLHLFSEEVYTPPAALTLWVAGITIVSKEALYRYTVHTARRFGSDMLAASAWHHRSDAISSVIVFFGIAGSLAGLLYLDALAAIGVALLVVKIGVDLGWRALRELIDTGLGAEELERLRRVILGVSGVKALHLLRTRRTGGRALVDVHIIVGEAISVSEGHQISEAVRTKLLREVEDVADVMVHIDTEDDVLGQPSAGLPLRDVVMARLQGYFRDIPQARHIDRTVLHYLNGRLRIELFLPSAAIGSLEEGRVLARRFQEAARQDPQIGKVEVLFY